MTAVEAELILKECRSCGERKPLDAFPRQAASRDGRYPHCTPCGSEKSREYRTRNEAEVKRRKRERYLANRDAERIAGRERYRRNAHSQRVSSWRAQGIALTWQGYLDIAEAQGRLCAICSKTEEANGKGLAVDHDHATGVVRGLLCDDCNLALGRFQDSPEVLKRALEYLGAANHLTEGD